MMTMRRLFIVLVALALCIVAVPAIAAASCGGDSGDGTTEEEEGPEWYTGTEPWKGFRGNFDTVVPGMRGSGESDEGSGIDKGPGAAGSDKGKQGSGESGGSGGSGTGGKGYHGGR
jgi:hypothetical protein